MIVSKSQSQATLPEERSRSLTSARLAIASSIVPDLGWLAEQQVSGSLAGDENHSLKWMATAKCAKLHSYTLARFIRT